jgi:formylglycine-generating enzyme required for sulfatase activity
MHGFRVVLVAFLLSTTAVLLSSSKSPQKETPPENMVLISGGEFIMGMDGDVDDNTAHKVVVDSFYIDELEVTNAAYLEFCKATDRRLPQFWEMEAFHSGPDFPNHPVVGVSWQDAKDYAEWRGKRLPTEAEWEYAARGGLIGKPFPHGDTLDPKAANFTQSELGGTVEVGSYSANGYGLHDMAGNVAEWVEDWYGADYYRKSLARDPKGPENGKFRVFRGGGWHSGPYCNRVVHRNGLPPNWQDFNIGFRCAKDTHE